MQLFNKTKTQNDITEKQKIFYKKLRIKNNTKEEDIKAKILKFVKKNKKLNLLYLTEKQQNDTIFMLSLYKTNPDVFSFYKPTKTLKHNPFYMKTCVKALIDGAEKSILKDKDKISMLLTEILGDLDEATKEIEFVKMLIDEYTSENMISILHNALIDNKSINMLIDQEAYTSFLNIINNLPKEYYDKITKHVGVDVLEFLPENHTYYIDLARQAVKKQGFYAISKLRPEFVAENISLLISATKVNSINDLYYYLKFNLSKANLSKSQSYESVKEAKKKILNDKRIMDLLYNEFFITNHMLDTLENV